VESDGRTLVVVQRVDLTASDPRARQLAVADNRTGEVGLLWDEEALRALQQEGVDLSHWWTESEWARLVGPDPCATGAHEDAVPSPTETTLRVGDLVTLGPHRLLCGDATNCDHVARLLNGLVPSLMVTDPPYGVEYDPAWRVAVDGSPGHALGRVPNDDRADWGDAFALFPGDVAYVWHAGLHAGTVAESLQRHQFELRAQIIWNKGHFVLSRGHYHWQHEPCWYAVRAGATATWQGDRTQTTVWDVPNLNPFGAAPAELDARTGHSAQKPVRLFERPLLNHTRPGDAVYDPFGGSGSALIAATKTARRCCMLELDPGYTQRIVDRWIAFTGRRADVDVERP
jgi:DNA modification methylase